MVEKENLMRYLIPYRKYLPKEFACLLKRFTAWCKECQRPFYPEHLEEQGVNRIRIFKHLFEDLEQTEKDTSINSDGNGRKKVNRTIVMESFAKYLKKVLCEVDHVLASYAEVL